MPNSAKIAIALLLLALMGVWGVHGQNRVKSVEAAIEAAAIGALEIAGADWAIPRAVGQQLFISGDAPDEAARDAAAAAAKSAIGPGGFLLGAVARVDTRAVKIAGPMPKEDFIWRAEHDGDRLQLSGYVPSAEAKNMLAQSIKRQFAGVLLEDATEIEPREDEGVWLVSAATTLGALKNLSAGGLVNQGDHYSLKGTAIDAQQAEMARAAMQGLPQPFYVDTVTIDIAAASAPAPATSIEGSQALDTAPALQTQSELAESPGEEIQLRPDELAASCQNALTQLLRDTPIQFASEQFAIADASLRTLGEMAEILSRCGAVDILIEGYTDNSGRRARNLGLSQKRADSVAGFLAATGVDRSAIAAHGRGASKPIAANNTRNGRARNRRIEINVSARTNE